ncbi:MAG: hypothetical protein LBM12_01720 [Candidatus Nomurabacteria bacterium]|jgi:hypothetical protein|nr:hypothetical protein [Candidatus Nomurabacteria bacterium]
MKKILRLIAAVVAVLGVSMLIATPAMAAPAVTTKAECIAAGGTWVPGNGCKGLPSGSGGSGGSSTDSDPCNGAILQVACGKDGEGIFAILNLVLNILTVGVGVAATGGMIFAALRYTQAKSDVAAAAGAKKMIIDIIIGLVIWAIFWALLQWLLPGGVL